MKQGTKAFNLSLIALVCFFFANGLVHADNIYVSCYSNNTIEVFDSSGNGSVFADSAAGLSLPEGLAFGSDGNLYVANDGNATIMKFSPNGQGSIFATGLS